MPAPVAIRGQRSLLKQIREALAGGGPAQQRLDMVVRIIARSMVAEVCSIYLRRANANGETDAGFPSHGRVNGVTWFWLTRP